LRGSTHSRSGQTVEIPDWDGHTEATETICSASHPQ
jgi:hypothetical protein